MNVFTDECWQVVTSWNCVIVSLLSLSSAISALSRWMSRETSAPNAWTWFYSWTRSSVLLNPNMKCTNREYIYIIGAWKWREKIHLKICAFFLFSTDAWPLFHLMFLNMTKYVSSSALRLHLSSQPAQVSPLFLPRNGSSLTRHHRVLFLDHTISWGNGEFVWAQWRFDLTCLCWEASEVTSSWETINRTKCH